MKIKLKADNIHDVAIKNECGEEYETELILPHECTLQEKFVEEFCESIWGSRNRCLVVEYLDFNKKYERYTIYENNEQSIYSQLLNAVREDLKA
jgi:hypothetical protein